MTWLADYGVAGVIGTAAGFAGAMLKDLVAARMRTDDELRKARVPLYQELWKLTDVLPKWPRETVTFAELHEFSGQLRTWYFERGGMYLSRRGQKRYVAVQDALAAASSAGSGEEQIPDPLYDAIRQTCSALRSELTEDLLSRREGARILA